MDGKTDVEKNPMLQCTKRGKKGFSQLTYIQEKYPKFVQTHFRVAKKRKYFEYINKFVQQNYKDLLNMFGKHYFDALVYYKV